MTTGETEEAEGLNFHLIAVLPGLLTPLDLFKLC